MMKVNNCHKLAVVTCSRHLAYLNDRKSVGQRAKVVQCSANGGLANVIRHQRSYILCKISRSAAYEWDVCDNRNYCFSIVCVYVIHSPCVELRHPIKRWLNKSDRRHMFRSFHKVYPVHYVTFWIAVEPIKDLWHRTLKCMEMRPENA